MTAPARRHDGYMASTRSTGMPRDVEYQIFSRITGKLNRGASEGADFALLVDALNENLALWMAIAMDVANRENGLPAGLRAQLFYLFEFTRAHTPRVLRREADPGPLVDINTSIMRGLRQKLPGKGTDQCQA